MGFSLLVSCEIHTSQFSMCGPKAFQVFLISLSLKKRKRSSSWGPGTQNAAALSCTWPAAQARIPLPLPQAMDSNQPTNSPSSPPTEEKHPLKKGRDLSLEGLQWSRFTPSS